MLFSYVISWAKKYDCIVMNPSFSEYSIYFQFFKDNQLCLIPNYYNIPSKFLKIIFKIINNSIQRITLRSNYLPFLQRINLESQYSNTKEINFSELLTNNRLIFFHGFLFGKRDFRLVECQRKFLSEIFSFSEHIQKQCVEILKIINKKRVIGICMRQGDYKDHFDGKFYLNDNEYKDLILKLRRLYPDYGFFIACEENKNNFHINNAYISYQKSCSKFMYLEPVRLSCRSSFHIYDLGCFLQKSANLLY